MVALDNRTPVPPLRIGPEKDYVVLSYLLADADVALADEDASMMDRLGKPKLEDLSLEPSLEEILDLEAEDVIELHPGLVEHADANETTQKSVALEQPSWVFLLEGQKVTSGLADFGQGEFDAPYLALVPQAILADQLQLLKRERLTLTSYNYFLKTFNFCTKIRSNFRHVLPSNIISLWPVTVGSAFSSSITWPQSKTQGQ